MVTPFFFFNFTDVIGRDKHPHVYRTVMWLIIFFSYQKVNPTSFSITFPLLPLTNQKWNSKLKILEKRYQLDSFQFLGRSLEKDKKEENWVKNQIQKGSFKCQLTAGTYIPASSIQIYMKHISLCHNAYKSKAFFFMKNAVLITDAT